MYVQFNIFQHFSAHVLIKDNRQVSIIVCGYVKTWRYAVCMGVYADSVTADSTQARLSRNQRSGSTAHIG